MKKKILTSIITMVMAVAVVAPVSASASTTLRGDINGNGVVSEADFDLLQSYVVADEQIDLDRTDLNNDGELTFLDLLVLKNILDTLPTDDVNGSGVVNQADFQLLRQRIADDSVDVNLARADVNSDGQISIADLTLLRHHLDDQMKGDVNGNGAIEQSDVDLLQLYIVDEDVEINEKNSDINDDGKVDFLDLLALQTKQAE